MSERQGIEIDYCPNCRGVWLDRGELDKIIEKSSVENNSDDNRRQQHYEKDTRKYDRPDSDYYKYKKRKSVWSELFDF